MAGAETKIAERLQIAMRELGIALAQVQKLPASNNAPTASEEYLSVSQLSARIPYREQTIRNLMGTGELKEGLHFYRRRRRIIFVWRAVLEWLKERSAPSDTVEPFIPEHHARSTKTS
jgi:hypothetical protein